MTVAVIINPISGTRGGANAARARGELAADVVSGAGHLPVIFITERPAHARELAKAAIEGGAALVIAWGGDGTVNEVVSTLMFTKVPLGVVPSGSGNGLARGLRIPADPVAALRLALSAPDRQIDCGELDGRPFVNIAGVGLDARVAHQFAAHGLIRRGFLKYLEISTRELLTYEANEYAIEAAGELIHRRAMIVAIANGRQYGNGALIAPGARIDDGMLDVVVVDDRPVWQTAMNLRRLFNGTLLSAHGVTAMRTETVVITSTRPILYQVDGEPFVGSARIAARVHPGALTVKAAV